MHRANQWLLPLLFVAGCHTQTQQVVSVEPLATLVPSLRLGVRAADFERQRPDAALDAHGVYAETIRYTDVWYYFWPRQPDRPAPLTSRLAAVESRETIHDSLNLRSTWQQRVSSLSRSRNARPTCQVMGEGRATLTRATFADSVRVSVTAEIRHAEDGQDFDAYLITRASRPAIADLEVPTPRNAQKVDCGALLPGRGGAAAGRR